MRNLWKAVVMGALVVLIGAFVSACGDDDEGDSGDAPAQTESSGEEIAIDVGTETLTFPAGTQPRVAMFAASGVPYQEAQRVAAEEMAAELGLEFTHFDSKFDPNLQMEQLQNALQSDEYDAWIFENLAGPAPCALISRQAPANGTVVVQTTVPTCDVAGEVAGEEIWVPGTLSTVAGATTKTYYDAFAAEVGERIEADDPQIGLLNGPPQVDTTILLRDSLTEAGLEPVVEVNSDYTTPDGLAQTQNMLQANPDLDAIVSIYSDSTLGAIKAIDQAGKTGEIQVFDLGGSKANKAAIQAGEQTMTAPYYPVSTAETGLHAIVDAFAGEPVERFYAGFAEGTPEEPNFITEENVDSYDPQY